jgi:hypothetical protein
MWRRVHFECGAVVTRHGECGSMHCDESVMDSEIRSERLLIDHAAMQVNNMFR